MSTCNICFHGEKEEKYLPDDLLSEATLQRALNLICFSYMPD